MTHARIIIDRLCACHVRCNYSVIAKMLGVSRQAVHIWMMGEIPISRVRDVARLSKRRIKFREVRSDGATRPK